MVQYSTMYVYVCMHVICMYSNLHLALFICVMHDAVQYKHSICIEHTL